MCIGVFCVHKPSFLMAGNILYGKHTSKCKHLSLEISIKECVSMLLL